MFINVGEESPPDYKLTSKLPPLSRLYENLIELDDGSMMDPLDRR